MFLFAERPGMIDRNWSLVSINNSRLRPVLPDILELARSLVESGDSAGAIEVLRPRLADLLDGYIAAVTPSDIRDTAQRLAATGELLFESYARLADWPAAFKLLDRLKALRARHRRALRRDHMGRELLELERQFFVAARGATPPLNQLKRLPSVVRGI